MRFSSTMFRAPEAATRDQLLVQVHAGFVAAVSDTLEGGLRFSAGDLNSNFGGTPLSAQFGTGDNGSRKSAFIDQAFIRWKPTLASGAQAALTLGKSANAFYTPSRILFDNDYNPEGATEEISFSPTPRDRVWLAAGQYVLDELAGTARDPWLLAARARWEAQWSPAWSSALGVGWLGVTHAAALTAANVANNNRGNTRSAAGVLTRDYRPFYAEASVTRVLDRAPGYAGKFPVTLHAELLHNSAAPADSEAWTAGLALGRSGKAGQWELSYRYLRIEADAWFEELIEGDFGGYYRSVPPGWNTDAASLAGGFGGGTNIRSHVFRTSYSPKDYLLFSANLFLNDLIRPYPARAPDTRAKRLQLETLLRF
jgi:Putative porin